MRIRWRNFELPSSVTVDTSSLTGNYAKFSIEPFEKGFGHTIGNGLRRVLLSSIEGTAVTKVVLDGVVHEFTTMPGVLEDMTDIVLNLKGLLVSLEGRDEAELTLSRNKKGKLTGKGADCPSGVSVLNPDHLICTLTDEVEVSMTVTVKRARGYVTADEHRGEGQQRALGEIDIDSNFSPIERVRYWVEETRVGKITNYDRLVLEIWTDGTVTPELALTQAAKIYRKHLNAFVHYHDLDKMVPAEESARQPVRQVASANDAMLGVMSKPIDALDLSVRSRHCLDSENIATVGDLVRRTEAELLTVRNFGATSLDEIKKKLATLELTLGMSSDSGMMAGSDS
jgi:DNA-directed RNA polymerase subunit alpha